MSETRADPLQFSDRDAREFLLNMLEQAQFTGTMDSMERQLGLAKAAKTFLEYELFRPVD